MIVFAAIILLVIWVVVGGIKESRVSEEDRATRVKRSKERLSEFKNRKR